MRMFLALLSAGSVATGGRLRFPGFPHTKSTNEGIGIVSCPATGREFLEIFGITSTDYDIVHLKGGSQPVDAERDMFPPLLFAEPF